MSESNHQKKPAADQRNIDNDVADGDKNHAEDAKKVSCKEPKFTCEDTPLWRIFMKSYIEQEKKLEIDDKFDRRQPPVLPKFPNLQTEETTPFPRTYACLPLNTFNLEERARLPDKRNRRDKIRLWKNMKKDPAVDTSSFLPAVLPKVSLTDSGKWPATWPCIARDLAGERRDAEKLKKRKAQGLLPCQEASDTDSSPDVPKDDFADHKELGHARIPLYCQSVQRTHSIDRYTGDKPGLVDGDYVLFLFDKGHNEASKRIYADVCLQGMKGMHLGELKDQRAREKTWKFCFYQALVALLAKTQLRYKFAWSVNIDYIFDHAWMLFVHMGSINVKARFRLDDVVVYNYKYSVELELVHEMKDAPRITGVGWNYAEEAFKRMIKLERPELMKTREEIGWEKPKTPKAKPVHELTRQIEKWFDKLPEIYRNCILRVSKFSIAFWKDATFWYLFNPYRCDEFGLWNNDGYGCFMKFPSRVSLRRHLMILLLRAYSYEAESSLKLSKPKSDNKAQDAEVKVVEETVTETEQATSKQEESIASEENKPKDTFTIEIYHLIYHCVKIHNVKLLQRKPPKPRMERVKKKETDECGLDPLIADDPCTRNGLEANSFENDDEEMENIEKASWLKELKIRWARFASSKKKKEDNENVAKLRWHQYYVEEPLKLFSLWGELHPTGHMFARENRGKQTQACYVVCAGMTRIQAPEYWSPKTLDAIVMCGDRYYTMSKNEWQMVGRTIEKSDIRSGERYLAKTFKIGETLYEIDLLDDICGRLYDKNGRSLWRLVEQMFLKQHFGILHCESSCLGIFKFCGAYYMMDVNSVGPPLFQYGDGVSYLIRAGGYQEFIKVLVLTIGSNECSRFSINPIVIDKMIDLGTTDLRDKPGRIELRKIECPYEDGPNKGSKKSKSKEQNRRKPTIDKVTCQKSGC